MWEAQKGLRSSTQYQRKLDQSQKRENLNILRLHYISRPVYARHHLKHHYIITLKSKRDFKEMFNESDKRLFW